MAETITRALPVHWLATSATDRAAIDIPESAVGLLCYQTDTQVAYRAANKGTGATKWVFLPGYPQTVNPAADSGAGSTILAETVLVAVGAEVNDTDDWITLPALASVDNGHEITILCNSGDAFELRTPASSGETINTVDCDGTQEYLCTDTETIKVTKVSTADGWTASAFALAGAGVVAVVPD